MSTPTDLLPLVLARPAACAPFPPLSQLMQLLDHPLVKVRSLTFTRNIELHDLQRFAPVLMQAKIETFDIKNCSAQPFAPHTHNSYSLIIACGSVLGTHGISCTHVRGLAAAAMRGLSPSELRDSGRLLGDCSPACVSLPWDRSPALLAPSRCRPLPAEIGPKGFFAIATALEMNTSITSLNLRKCDLGPLAGAKVGQMLRGNTAITTLNVSVNNIRSEGCREARKLPCCTWLFHISAALSPSGCSDDPSLACCAF